MKNLFSILLVLGICYFGTTLSAQSMASVDNLTANNPGKEKVQILEDFTATKTQKKVIKKVQKYVTPRVLGRNVRTAALDGKAVKLQMALNADGLIDYVVVVDGLGEKLDERVIKLVKEYNQKRPFATSDLEKPSVMQLEIPVTRKKQYGE